MDAKQNRERSPRGNSQLGFVTIWQFFVLYFGTKNQKIDQFIIPGWDHSWLGYS